MPGLKFHHELAKESITGQFLDQLQEFLNGSSIIYPVTNQRGDDLAVAMDSLSFTQTATMAIHPDTRSDVGCYSGSQTPQLM